MRSEVPRRPPPTDERRFLVHWDPPSPPPVRPEAWYIARHKLWDPVWLLIHEAVAIPFWFLTGLRIDAGRSRLRKPMLWYLVGRGGLGLLVLGPRNAPNFGVLLRFLFWIGFSIYGFVCAIQWIGRKVNPLRESSVNA